MDPEEPDYDAEFGRYWFNNNMEYRLTSDLLVSIFRDL